MSCILLSNPKPNLTKHRNEKTQAKQKPKKKKRKKKEKKKQLTETFTIQHMRFTKQLSSDPPRPSGREFLVRRSCCELLCSFGDDSTGSRALQCRKLRRSTQQDTTTTIAHLLRQECWRRRLSATPSSAFVVWLRRCDKNDATRPGGRPGPARSIGAPPDTNYYRWRGFFLKYNFYNKYLFIKIIFQWFKLGPFSF